jgi:predicted nucleotidyltransferase
LLLELREKRWHELERIAGKHHLKLVVVYDSTARGEERPGSDVDLAVLGEKELGSEALLELSFQFQHLVGEAQVHLVSLHRVDPFFRYQVTRDSILLYGEPLDYHDFRAYAFRAYVDSRDLLRLERRLTERTLSHLRGTHA